MLRLLRLLRVFVSGSDTAMARAAREVTRAVHERRLELAVSFSVAALVLMGASIAMYLVERRVQPEVFGSIPRAVWWAIATLTTVGYGDVYPETTLGRVAASVIAMAGIGVVALPAGVFASAFSDELRARADARKEEEARRHAMGLEDPHHDQTDA